MKTFWQKCFPLVLGLVVLSAGCRNNISPSGQADNTFPASALTFIDEELPSGHKIQPGANGGFLVLGNSDGIAPNEIQLTKFDIDLNITWSKRYTEGSKIDRGHDLLVTSDGGYIVCGYTLNLGAGSRDVYLLKVDADGEKQWSHAYGDTDSDTGVSVIELSTGGFMVIGFTEVPESTLETAVLMLRLDENGAFIWKRIIDKNFNSNGWSVLETAQDEVAIMGLLSNDIEGNGLYFAKMDLDGNVLAENVIEQEGIWPSSEDFIATKDGGFAMAVSASRESLLSPQDFLLFKLNAMGELQWSKVYGGHATDFVHGILQNDNGEFIMVGSSSSFDPNGTGLYIVKADEGGGRIWHNLYGVDVLAGGWDILSIPNEGYLISGSITIEQGNNPDFKLMLLKIDEDGIPQ